MCLLIITPILFYGLVSMTVDVAGSPTDQLICKGAAGFVVVMIYIIGFIAETTLVDE